ncbi:MAG: ATP-binding cassette domain-containing protein [Acidiferrobacter sp.]
MSLLRLDELSLAYGHHLLLDHAHLTIERGERVCLIGRNGEGKSSLLRIISATINPDSGQRVVQAGARIGTLDQEVDAIHTGCVYDIVAGGLAALGAAVAEYDRLAANLGATPDARIIERLGVLQQVLDAHDGWRLQQRIETVLTDLKLDGRADMAALSGGWRRRVMLARALVSEPDLLLLDEPTNHLDIEAVLWLEDYLTTFGGAVLFVSHDRAFLRRLATRIIELDRGALTSWPGTYEDYQRRKADQRAAEETQNALFDKRLAAEETWIRQGIKARRTRNEGRVRALEALRQQYRQRRARPGQAALTLSAAEASGKLVFEAVDASFGYADQTIIRDFSTRVMRGDRVALIGANGVGKSTLLKLLLGTLTPSRGVVRTGTKIEAAYFDQQRAQLDPAATVMDSVGAGKLTVTINGQTQHVAGYLQRFLFPAERLRSPVSMLSGGERNRLLLARLFAQPANLLVLDEPTNDLDADTLELLEDVLIEYTGTLLLVSHDRQFVDNVVTSTWVFEGDGKIGEFAGGYSDWQRVMNTPPLAPMIPVDVRPAPPRAARPAAAGTRRLSYKEQRERELLPQRIETLEKEQQDLQKQLSAPQFYQQQHTAIARVTDRLAAIDEELAGCYDRWTVLESG